MRLLKKNNNNPLTSLYIGRYNSSSFKTTKYYVKR